MPQHTRRLLEFIFPFISGFVPYSSFWGKESGLRISKVKKCTRIFLYVGADGYITFFKNIQPIKRGIAILTENSGLMCVEIIKHGSLLFLYISICATFSRKK
jgi:hypothetical protein